jgi:2-dehydro-3-deoxyphosphogalactonate aldolase
MNELPLIAILRGITLDEVEPVTNALVAAGVRYLEIPLNSPAPLRSIERMIELHGANTYCGAGTVQTVAEVNAIADLGGKLIVSPHLDTEIVAATLTRNMLSFPGVATITEALTAIRVGANQLKLFPAGDLGSGYLKSISAVLPDEVCVFAVGNIGLEDLESFSLAGASGFGIGSGLYRPGVDPDQVFRQAEQFVKAIEQLFSSKLGQTEKI